MIKLLAFCFYLIPFSIFGLEIFIGPEINGSIHENSYYYILPNGFETRTKINYMTGVSGIIYLTEKNLGVNINFGLNSYLNNWVALTYGLSAIFKIQATDTIYPYLSTGICRQISGYFNNTSSSEDRNISASYFTGYRFTLGLGALFKITNNYFYTSILSNYSFEDVPDNPAGFKYFQLSFGYLFDIKNNKKF